MKFMSEKYIPSPKEVNKAEAMMTEKQKIQSEAREEGFRAGESKESEKRELRESVASAFEFLEKNIYYETKDINTRLKIRKIIDQLRSSLEPYHTALRDAKEIFEDFLSKANQSTLEYFGGKEKAQRTSEGIDELVRINQEKLESNS